MQEPSINVYTLLGESQVENRLLRVKVELLAQRIAELEAEKETDATDAAAPADEA